MNPVRVTYLACAIQQRKWTAASIVTLRHIKASINDQKWLNAGSFTFMQLFIVRFRHSCVTIFVIWALPQAHTAQGFFDLIEKRCEFHLRPKSQLLTIVPSAPLISHSEYQEYLSHQELFVEVIPSTDMYKNIFYPLHQVQNQWCWILDTLVSGIVIFILYSFHSLPQVQD